MGQRGYPPEFRRKVLDLIQSGRSVADVSHDLEISEQSIYTWRRQDRIDRGLLSGLTSGEKAELTAANKRIADLEAELAVSRRTVELLREEVRPKRRFAAAEVVAAEHLPVQLVCRVLDISESGSTSARTGRRRSARSGTHG